MRTPISLTTLLVCATACSVDADLTGKLCPCLPGYSCNPATGRCVAGTPGREGAITIVAFDADWATPNAIRWGWELAGDPNDFHAVEVVVGGSEQDVLAGDNVTVWAGEQNPELDRFFLPHTEGEDPMTHTLTDGLEPDTDYFAQLQVVDTTGATSISPNVARIKTALPPINGAVIFSDTEPWPPGAPEPECYRQSFDAPYADTQSHYQYVHYCRHDDNVESGSVASCVEPATPSAECWGNLWWDKIQRPVEQLSEGAFLDAYLEIAIALLDPQGATEPHHAWWGELALGEKGSAFPYYPFTLRSDGQYRLYQIKLSEFGMSYSDLNQMVTGFRLGANWTHGATVRVDEVWIRW